MAQNRSALRTMEILEYISVQQVPQSLTDISTALNIPKTSTFDIVTGLVKEEYLVATDTDFPKYKLGHRLFQLGHRYLDGINVYEICRGYMTDLANEFERTVLLATLQAPNILYLEKTDPANRFLGIASVAKTQPAHSTGLGKAILSAYKDKEIREMMGEGPYIARTPNTLTTIDALLEDIQAIRKRGYSLDNQENEINISCIAVPVIGADNRPQAGISITGPTSSYQEEEREEIAIAMTQMALEISYRLGYRKKTLY